MPMMKSHRHVTPEPSAPLFLQHRTCENHHHRRRRETVPVAAYLETRPQSRWILVDRELAKLDDDEPEIDAALVEVTTEWALVLVRVLRAGPAGRRQR